MSTPSEPEKHLLDYRPPSRESTPDNILEGFLDAMIDRGMELYPAQEEALLEIAAGKHVVLNTPTGSGKSLVALGLHFKALSEGKRCYYTSPVKALVSEKFFALCHDLGAENVGMMTGDASINRDAPILCCTAEILSNLALREGERESSIDYVVMDEFHYYSDNERGTAWQVPLLTLPSTTFLLMSATLGDMSSINRSLEDYTGREVAWVRSVDRPVPLDFRYSEEPLHETIEDLVSSNRAPIYIVNFTQRACAEMAQALMSTNFSTKEDKQKIKESIGDFRFDSTYGKEMGRFVRHGLGIHHAGLLPKYRLLVEQIAQQGQLKVICGTDTLGVGVNIPIRTVLFTQLCKFDGEKTGILSVRDFKQISGRAGRKGFDDEGTVVCQAPEHVIENLRQERRIGSDSSDAAKKKRKKLVKKKPPEKGYVHWDAQTFERLQKQEPESLSSQFEVSHAMLLNLLQGTPTTGENAKKGGGYRALVELIARNHDDDAKKRQHRKRAAQLFRSLREAKIIAVESGRVVVDENLQLDFSLNHVLSLYLVEALSSLDETSETYALDTVSLVESILENPRVILRRQVDVAKTNLINALKAEGVEYDERMEKLEKVSYPKPLADFIYETFNAFASHHPWVGAENIRPKSIIREMYERYCSFGDYVREYGLQRSEGILLRQVNQTYRVLLQTVPDAAKTDGVLDVIGYLRAMLGRVDTSLLEEWESLVSGEVEPGAEVEDDGPIAPKPFDPVQDPRGFIARVRAELHAIVRSLAQGDYEEAARGIRHREGYPEWTAESLQEAMAPYFEDHEKILFDPRARAPSLSVVRKRDGNVYTAQQVLYDPAEDLDWMLDGEVVVDADMRADEPLICLIRVGR